MLLFFHFSLKTYTCTSIVDTLLKRLGMILLISIHNTDVFFVKKLETVFILMPLSSKAFFFFFFFFFFGLGDGGGGGVRGRGGWGRVWMGRGGGSDCFLSIVFGRLFFVSLFVFDRLFLVGSGLSVMILENRNLPYVSCTNFFTRSPNRLKCYLSVIWYPWISFKYCSAKSRT